MFRQTHLKLTFLNSLVFIVLISILGGIIYFYTEEQLYRDVNHDLLESINVTINVFQNQPPPVDNDNGIRGPKFMHRDPRNMILVWDENNQLFTDQNRGADFFKNLEKQIQPKKLNSLQDVNVKNFSYRYIAEKVDTQFGKLTVQVIRNIDSEKELLDRLLLIIAIGCGVGIICAVALGYFLAGRALVPIKNAWQKQQEFVSDASHELRTPLAVILAKTDLLFRAPKATIQDKIQDISTISNESRRLSKLVGNLLTLARSDSDQIEMKKELFSLDDLLAEIAEHYEEIIMYQEKSLVLKVEEPVLFFADKERIHQLIVILLDNAMKYTDAGGEIHLSCTQSHSLIILKVQDTGIGIPDEDIPKIFDRFYQSDKTRTAAEGTGLGLSIAKWIIEKHHGRVKVQSKLGEGTLFEITFPKAQK